MSILKNILEAIGNTPLVRINKLTRHLKSDIYAKVESLNPGGSVKDRIGGFIIDEAERTGKLNRETPALAWPSWPRCAAIKPFL